MQVRRVDRYTPSIDDQSNDTIMIRGTQDAGTPVCRIVESYSTPGFGSLLHGPLLQQPHSAVGSLPCHAARPRREEMMGKKRGNPNPPKLGLQATAVTCDNPMYMPFIPSDTAVVNATATAGRAAVDQDKRQQTAAQKHDVKIHRAGQKGNRKSKTERKVGRLLLSFPVPSSCTPSL